MEEESDARLEPPALARVLAVLRVSRGFRQEDWANAAKVRPGTISYYEQGKLVPSLKTLQKLMKALGYPLAAVEKTEGYLLDLGSPAFWVERPGLLHPHPGGNPLEREIEAVAQERGRVEVRRARLELSLLAGWPHAARPGWPAEPGEEPEEATA